MRWFLPFNQHRDDLILGQTKHFWFPSKIGVRQDQRTTHMYVLGITGQGKSKLLQHCLYQDIIAGRGCGLLDPHIDLARDLLASLASNGFFREEKNRKRVIYFDPSRKDSLIPFNVLAGARPPYETATQIVEAFRRTWPESLREAPRFTNILLASLLVLLTNHLTLVDLPSFLTDRKFREELLENVSDPELVSVFHQRLDRWGREQPLILESILNKVSAFTLNPTLRRILGHPNNNLDFRRMMDEGLVFLADLGRCDGETRRLLGSLITIGIEQAALSRKDEPTRSRRPFHFYMDEFQDFCANEGSARTLSEILSESRKFGLHLTLAHQTLGQMEHAHLVSALGNVGIKVVFAIDRMDAEIMVKKLFAIDTERVKHLVTSAEQQDKSHPVYYSLQEEWEQSIQQIQNLPPRNCLVKVQRQKVVQMETIPLTPATVEERALEEVRKMLLENWGEGTRETDKVERLRAAQVPLVTAYEAVNESPVRKRIQILE